MAAILSRPQCVNLLEAISNRGHRILGDTTNGKVYLNSTMRYKWVSQYVPWNMHTVLVCSFMLYLYHRILIDTCNSYIRFPQATLTHWGRDEIDAILQTTVSRAFSWMKIYRFRIKFHWSLFPRVQLPIFQRWFRQWLGADQATSHCLNQWWVVYWRIYASLGLNELTVTGKLHDCPNGCEVVPKIMIKHNRGRIVYIF